MSQDFIYFTNKFSQSGYAYFVFNGIEFNSSEQFMMYQKALLFGDIYTSIQILLKPNPGVQKTLGRNISDFDERIWTNISQQIVYMGNYLKFSQNEKLMKDLLETGDAQLIYAVEDLIWGIGLSEYNAVKIPNTVWPGKNLLGKILMQIREDLRRIT